MPKIFSYMWTLAECREAFLTQNHLHSFTFSKTVKGTISSMVDQFYANSTKRCLLSDGGWSTKKYKEV